MSRRPGLLLAALLISGAVLHAQGTVPTPQSVLGFQPGADYKLATYDDALKYFRALDAASDRMQLVQVHGTTSYGHDWYFALISSPANLQNIDRLKQIAQRLAHPAGLTDDEARKLAQEGKAFVHIDGGLHATEVAGPQHTLQLAYDLVSGADPKLQAMLDDVVVILWPTINPDGQNIVANWYRQHVGTPFEVAPLPELYQKYIGHDNNRDGYMLNMIETREIYRTWREWEPQIVYVHHQSSPFPTRIWLPPFAEPIAPEVPPLMSRMVNTIGMAIAQGLEEHGQPGATHMGTGFDAWYPGYIDYLPMLQNINSFWTETALYRYATPHYYTMNDFPRDMRELRSESLYPSPWKGGWWHLRDAVEYMLTASKSVIEYASHYKDALLYNRYQAGRDQIRRGTEEPPYAYIVPQAQHDPVAPVELLRRLAFNGIRVSQLRTAATQEGTTYPAGTWVVPTAQEFGNLARQLLEVQHYPDLREFPDGPPEQPYDAAGWTLPYQMDVRVVEARTPLSDEFKAAMVALGAAAGASGTDGAAADITADAAPFDSVPGLGFDGNPVAHAIVPPDGRITGSGAALAVDPAQNNAFRAINAAWKAGASVRYVPGRDGASGRYVIEGASPSFVDAQVKSLALQAGRTAAGAGTALPRPRLALYQPWTASMDEGWTRWLFEQYGFQFTSLHNADVQSGRLADRYDVIVIADDRPRSLLDGFQHGTVPPRYEGGLGADGVRALDAFVRAGGTLVCLNNSSVFAIDELHLPVRNVIGGVKPQEFFASGSILSVTVDPSHQVTAGMPAQASIFFDDSPVFEPQKDFEGTVLASYQESGSPLMSGYLLGESRLHGKAAALDVKLGAGHIVLIGFRPQWRGQPFGTFRVLFNAALFHVSP